jgi:hypothetical protein
MVNDIVYLQGWEIYIYGRMLPQLFKKTPQNKISSWKCYWTLIYSCEPQCKDTDKGAYIAKIGQTLLVSYYYHIIPIAFVEINVVDIHYQKNKSFNFSLDEKNFLFWFFLDISLIS